MVMFEKLLEQGIPGREGCIMEKGERIKDKEEWIPDSRLVRPWRV
jgi:hypothetical protein